jgi:protein-tyrosine phosphatase
MVKIKFLYLSCTVVGLILASSLSLANNLHLIEELPNGFAIYRSGKPSAEDIAEFRKLGISEIVVLSGNADNHEFKYRDEYPDLQVVYNEEQSHKQLPSDEFLDWFDAWVEEARRVGKKIAFRCNCGCHRTGRLAAYYQMKWQNMTYADVLVIMKKYGSHMSFYRHLDDQVMALQKRIHTQRAVVPVEASP